MRERIVFFVDYVLIVFRAEVEMAEVVVVLDPVDPEDTAQSSTPNLHPRVAPVNKDLPDLPDLLEMTDPMEMTVNTDFRELQERTDKSFSPLFLR